MKRTSAAMTLLKLKPKRVRTSSAPRGRPEGSLSLKWRNWIVLNIPEIIKNASPYSLTIRQIYYQLVANYKMKKKEGNYNYLCKKLVQARQCKFIEWNKIVDLTRKPMQIEWLEDIEFSTPSRWWNYFLNKFIESLENFSIPAFQNQDFYVEVWSEHEGLQPLFKEALKNYPLTIYFTRGRNSWSNFYEAQQRLEKVKDRKIIILHFADCDKYGLEMTEDLKKAFLFFHVNAEVERIALTSEQVETWNLPDTQLEAIPIPQFVDLIRESVEKYVDKYKLDQIRQKRHEGQKIINEWMEKESLEGLEKE